jgi:hypothetical protein
VRDVAAPLYRFFLADAQAAVRDGDTERMLECLALALDFAPESQRERVLLAAGELVPAASAYPGAPPRAAPAQPLVVEIAPVSQRPLSRISWEDRAVPSAPAFVLPASPPAAQPATLGVRGGRGVGRLLVVLAVLAGLAASAVRLGWIPAVAEDALRGDRTERAAHLLAGGDAAGALEVLDPLGADAPARAWLVRGAAYEALADTAAAVAALGTAAGRDADGGRWALEAGDRLARLGATSAAADAYLYAVTPDRTRAELDRIAAMQERAGHPDRARRVRAR